MSNSISACACVTSVCASSKGPCAFCSVPKAFSPAITALRSRSSAHCIFCPTGCHWRIAVFSSSLGPTATLVNANQTGHAMPWLSCRGGAGGGSRLRTVSQCSGKRQVAMETVVPKADGRQLAMDRCSVNLSTCQPVILSTCQPVSVERAFTCVAECSSNTKTKTARFVLLRWRTRSCRLTSGCCPGAQRPQKGVCLRREQYTFLLGSPPPNCMWTAIAIRCSRGHQVLE